jgi:prolyl-tRNA editing enzyme YbaK/EbsC (Cys-tRNA(Pro) deacylase)
MRSQIDNVRNFLESKEVEFILHTFKESTDSSFLASRVLGCSVAEIAKSIVFKASFPVIAVLSGDKRVNRVKLENILGQNVTLADHDYVIKMTGYEIGGVPPFPHRDGIRVIPDISLMRFKHVWASAGSRNSVFRVSVKDLIRLICSEVYDISE